MTERRVDSKTTAYQQIWNGLRTIMGDKRFYTAAYRYIAHDGTWLSVDGSRLLDLVRRIDAFDESKLFGFREELVKMLDRRYPTKLEEQMMLPKLGEPFEPAKMTEASPSLVTPTEELAFLKVSQSDVTIWTTECVEKLRSYHDHIMAMLEAAKEAQKLNEPVVSEAKDLLDQGIDTDEPVRVDEQNRVIETNRPVKEIEAEDRVIKLRKLTAQAGLMQEVIKEELDVGPLFDWASLQRLRHSEACLCDRCVMAAPRSEHEARNIAEWGSDMSGKAEPQHDTLPPPKYRYSEVYDKWVEVVPESGPSGPHVPYKRWYLRTMDEQNQFVRELCLKTGRDVPTCIRAARRTDGKFALAVRSLLLHDPVPQHLS